MSKKFRVRCAPSPSGTLHVGNAKTFLFNYLFSRKYDADFVLRIEDTDTARVVDQGAEKILSELNWLGLTPTMGWGTDNCPAGAYTQMERLPTYKKYAEQLLEQGDAYRCYCTEEELTKARDEAMAKNPKHPFKYPGTCRDIKERLDKPFVIRFKAPTEGTTDYEDVAFGKRSVPNKENYDFVILRHSEIPLFNFANCIDDLVIDNITHVIRGSDHLKNTPQQVMIADALKLERPIYCHLPMLLNAAGGKLSKRDGSVSVAEFREMGFTPHAILNYLVRFGWSHKDQEIFSLDQMIDLFAIEDCGKNDGKFDMKKFTSVQYEHLKSEALTSTDEYEKMLLPFLKKKGLVEDAFTSAKLRAAMPLVRARAHTLVEAADEMMPFVIDTIENPDFKDVSMKVREKVSTLITALDSDPAWGEDHLRQLTKNWLVENDLSLKELGGFMRLSLTGRSHSPELFQVMATLGRRSSIKRLEIGASRLTGLDK
jgi:glutamyl-tRNA synthetase